MVVMRNRERHGTQRKQILWRYKPRLTFTEKTYLCSQFNVYSLQVASHPWEVASFWFSACAVKFVQSIAHEKDDLSTKSIDLDYHRFSLYHLQNSLAVPRTCSASFFVVVGRLCVSVFNLPKGTDTTLCAQLCVLTAEPFTFLIFASRNNFGLLEVRKLRNSNKDEKQKREEQQVHFTYLWN